MTSNETPNDTPNDRAGYIERALHIEERLTRGDWRHDETIGSITVARHVRDLIKVTDTYLDGAEAERATVVLSSLMRGGTSVGLWDRIHDARAYSFWLHCEVGMPVYKNDWIRLNPPLHARVTGAESSYVPTDVEGLDLTTGRSILAAAEEVAKEAADRPVGLFASNRWRDELSTATTAVIAAANHSIGLTAGERYRINMLLNRWSDLSREGEGFDPGTLLRDADLFDQWSRNHDNDFEGHPLVDLPGVNVHPASDVDLDDRIQAVTAADISYEEFNRRLTEFVDTAPTLDYESSADGGADGSRVDEAIVMTATALWAGHTQTLTPAEVDRARKIISAVGAEEGAKWRTLLPAQVMDAVVDSNRFTEFTNAVQRGYYAEVEGRYLRQQPEYTGIIDLDPIIEIAGSSISNLEPHQFVAREELRQHVEGAEKYVSANARGLNLDQLAALAQLIATARASASISGAESARLEVALMALTDPTEDNPARARREKLWEVVEDIGAFQTLAATLRHRAPVERGEQTEVAVEETSVASLDTEPYFDDSDETRWKAAEEYNEGLAYDAYVQDVVREAIDAPEAPSPADIDAEPEDVIRELIDIARVQARELANLQKQIDDIVARPEPVQASVDTEVSNIPADLKEQLEAAFSGRAHPPAAAVGTGTRPAHQLLATLAEGAVELNADKAVEDPGIGAA
ncbi:hypothetical protein [Nocardia sp. XZ_19_231]|uniref:hypothetical protein n=1 Tax=Nocardia sp. XZ_19_231 TaxID=2769252 RepID=UPI00188FCE83|nr:hypothetical protein [Nocardia sp. XZ_19_231]